MIQYSEVNEGAVFSFFAALVPVWVVLCLAALVVRYRRAGRVERQQIKWLLVATAVFAAAYIPVFLVTDFDFGPNTVFWSYLWMVAMLLIPASIGIAILRYRLCDIDLIIRKTLVYVVLDRAAGVGLLRQRGAACSGVRAADRRQQSPWRSWSRRWRSRRCSTPLRNRIQDSSTGASTARSTTRQQVLAQFAITARDETDMNALSVELMNVVKETLAPTSMSIWLQGIRVYRSDNARFAPELTAADSVWELQASWGQNALRTANTA